MAAHNAAAHIGEALDSLCAQEDPAWTLVVVDDGSTDDTAARVLAREDPRIRLVRQENRGVSAARNRGIAESSGDPVLFLDADDRLLPGALRRMRAALAQAPGAVVAYGEAATIDAAGTPLHDGAAPLFRERPAGRVLDRLVRQNFVLNGGAACIRRDALARIGGFREDLRVGEDWVLWCHAAALGSFIHIGPPPLLAYRIHAGSAMRAQATTLEDGLRAVAAIHDDPRLTGALDARGARRARAAAEAGIYSLVAGDALRAGAWAGARNLLWSSVRRDPRRLREWLLLGCAVAGWLPAGVRRRLK
jgi:hypothetical protein